MPKQPLTLADKEAIRQIRRWPTLYYCARDFFHACVIGSQGGYLWKKGKLVSTENSTFKHIRGRNIRVPYPNRVSEKTSQEFLNRDNDRIPTVYPIGRAPIQNLPDDLHPEWADFISLNLYKDCQLTPELYGVLMDAHDILHYGMKRNPMGSTGHYIYEWGKYHARIQFYQAALRMIEEKKRLGMTPPAVYQGMDI